MILHFNISEDLNANSPIVEIVQTPINTFFLPVWNEKASQHCNIKKRRSRNIVLTEIIFFFKTRWNQKLAWTLPLPDKALLIALLILWWLWFCFDRFPFGWRTSFWLLIFVMFSFKLFNFIKVKFSLITVMIFVSRMQWTSAASSAWWSLEMRLMQQTGVRSIENWILPMRESEK